MTEERGNKVVGSPGHGGRRRAARGRMGRHMQIEGKTRRWAALAWWTVFGTAFGYTEAMLVVYLRRLMGMPPGWGFRQFYAARGLAFSSASVFAEMARLGILRMELTREVATLVLLLGAACAAGRTGRERLGLFAWTFAVWDLTYYGWLRLWTGFPRGLSTTDVYFLVPIAWYGPVWFPVLVFMPATLVFAWWLLLSRTQPRTAARPAGPSA